MNIKDNIKLATSVTTVTLVGYFGDYPREKGNCFSVSVEGETQDCRIVNFNYENLDKIMKDGVISFPLKISKLADRIAIIADERIPNEWYSKRLCETCTPSDLLPVTQRLKHFLDIERGIREEREVEIDGKKMKLVSIKVEPKIVHVPYTFKETPDDEI